MAGKLSPQEEDQLVAEAEAIYESGGYDLDDISGRRVDPGPDPAIWIMHEFRFSPGDMDRIDELLDQSGMTLATFLDAAVRTYAGLAGPPEPTPTVREHIRG